MGRGRLGAALAAALADAGHTVTGPHGRGETADHAGVVILAVPDGQIANAAAQVAPGRLVGHCSGATTLDPLHPHEAFSLHPLMTVTAEGARFDGAAAAIAGTTETARCTAADLATSLGMTPVEVADEHRAAYHAAASVASNFLVTLQAAAERLAETAGVDRDHLVPLVRASVENWAALGPEKALTGPVARGDHETVARQRAEIEERAPDLLPLFDALVDATKRKSGPPARPRMRTVRTVAELREALEPERRAGRRIGLVPTMGAFHEGHLSLMRAARDDADVVVVSLFVNPAQFNASEDLSAYPRDEASDAAMAAAERVDVLFAPSVEEVYPDGAPTTDVRVHGLTEPLEGISRGPGHFRGVTTVVAKLFNMVRPDVAYFGAKDAQQAAVVRRMVRDLDFGIEIVTLPTIREPDGLAMSSRNGYLGTSDRERAIALRRALDAAEQAVATGERDPASVARLARDAMRPFGVEPEYLALVEPTTFAPVSAIDGDVLVAVAARVGPARLIDNTLIRTNGRH